jgi:hypothetical protein
MPNKTRIRDIEDLAERGAFERAIPYCKAHTHSYMPFPTAPQAVRLAKWAWKRAKVDCDMTDEGNPSDSDATLAEKDGNSVFPCTPQIIRGVRYDGSSDYLLLT